MAKATEHSLPTDPVHVEAVRVRSYLAANGVGQLVSAKESSRRELVDGPLISWSFGSRTGLGIEVEYVGAEITGATHAWLCVYGQTIDTTGDQFGNGLEPVFVGEEAALHRSFGTRRVSRPVFNLNSKCSTKKRRRICLSRPIEMSVWWS